MLSNEGFTKCLYLILLLRNNIMYHISNNVRMNNMSTLTSRPIVLYDYYTSYYTYFALLSAVYLTK